MVCRIAVLGLGKIAQDQHLPCIAKNPAFTLAATVSRHASVPNIPHFESLSGLIESKMAIDAVAICTPPHVRLALAAQALDAGFDVLIEKPPTPTLGEMFAMIAHAKARNRVLYATWHSRYNAAVDEAKRRLAGQQVTKLKVTWREDVRHWHPGQEWIWQPGGFGVFDPGINAFSIVTKIMPEPVFVERAVVQVPGNKATPIAADVVFKTGDGRAVDYSANLDWRQTGTQTWDIAIETAEGMALTLTKGGSVLVINGETVMVAPLEEYEMIYERFATLLAQHQSDTDVSPLQLVCDCFMLAKPVVVEDFV
jgi:D-galactose 1-dehydrogenase